MASQGALFHFLSFSHQIPYNKTMRYQTVVSRHTLGPYSFQFHCIENFEKTVDEMYADLKRQGRVMELETLCPYFGTLWPSAKVLASWLLEQGEEAFHGKSVMELGCGIGLPSFLCAKLGAVVMATDFHPDVPVFLARNLGLNPGVRVSYRHVNWNNAAALQDRFDWIVASDVLYEFHQAVGLVRFLKSHLSPQGKALIADPNRSYWGTLLTEARQSGLKASFVQKYASDKEDPEKSLLFLISR